MIDEPAAKRKATLPRLPGVASTKQRLPAPSSNNPLSTGLSTPPVLPNVQLPGPSSNLEDNREGFQFPQDDSSELYLKKYITGNNNFTESEKLAAKYEFYHFADSAENLRQQLTTTLNDIDRNLREIQNLLSRGCSLCRHYTGATDPRCTTQIFPHADQEPDQQGEIFG